LTPLDSKLEYSDDVFEQLALEGREVVSSSFRDCRFVRCDLREATFRSCSFEGCEFAECELSLVRLPHCSFASTEFDGCKMIGVNWAEARWPAKRIWPPLGFERCVMDHSTFLGLDLKGVRIVDCSAKDADFRETLLAGAVLSGSDLSGALFGETDLTDADLKGALNYAIDPRANTLKGAKFSLPEAMSLLAELDVEISGWD